MKTFLQSKWNDILDFMVSEYDISRVSVTTWIAPLQIHSITNDKIIVFFDDEKLGLNLEFVNRKYKDFLRIAILEIATLDEKYRDFLSSDYILEIVYKSSLEDDEPAKNSSSFSSKNIKNAKTYNLNPRYVFENFVVSTNNNLAHAASLAVAEAPAEVYNPLYIYGGVGLGKTHLMHSIAQFIIKNHKNLNVMYVQSETFTNELIESIRHGAITPPEFRDKYRSVDVLLIDDIQFIIGKERTQEEFFHTFNILYESKKQIVISSDKPPKDLTTLEDRLRSRFECGLIVDMQSPDFETRMAILKKKQELNHLKVSDDIIRYIAMNVKSNIRELEGSLTKIVAMSRLQKREINISLAEEALADIISPDRNRKISIQLIIETVAEHFSITPAEICSTNRSRNVAYPRQIAMYLCGKLTDLTRTEIGKSMGNRDHSTIIHGIDKVTSDLKNDISLQNTLEILTKKISPQ